MELYYFDRDDILFYVADIINDFNFVDIVDSSNSVEGVVRRLNDGARKLAKACGGDKKDVKTFIFKTKSNQEKRVFWIKTNNIPEGTKKLYGNTWTMERWLENLPL